VSGNGVDPDAWLRRVLGAAAALSAVAVLVILGALVGSCLPLLRSGDLLAVVTGPWRPYGAVPTFGIAPMILSSAAVALLAVALAFPTAVGICSFAHGVGPRRLRRPALAAVHFMTSVPTVVLGFVSVFLLVPRLRQAFATGPGFCLLAAAITLAVLVLPTVVLLVHVHLRLVDPGVRLACEALGLSAAEAQFHVLFPLARRGLVTAAVLGFARALGDTLVALMVAGNAPQWPTSPLESVRTLTAHVALVLATDTASPEYRSVAVAGLLLFLMTATLTLSIRRLGGSKAGDA
jgi:phosphate transport system permease protein